MPRPPSPHRAAQLSAIKEQTRRLLGLGDEDTVMVRQLDCAEPGCPPVETVVAVLPPDGPGRRWTLHHPVAEITPELLTRALAGAPAVPEGE